MSESQSKQAFRSALVGGTILQLTMVVAGHYSPTIAALFAVGGMSISMLAGGLFGLWSVSAGREAASRGALVGGGCGLIGIAVSYALGDVTATILVFGTASSAVTGAIGGWAGAVIRSRRRMAV